MSDHAGKTIVDTVSKNPLLVAGIGLVIGGLIASAIRASAPRSGWSGEARRRLKNRARDMAIAGSRRARTAASAADQDVARRLPKTKG